MLQNLTLSLARRPVRGDAQLDVWVDFARVVATHLHQATDAGCVNRNRRVFFGDWVRDGGQPERASSAWLVPCNVGLYFFTMTRPNHRFVYARPSLREGIARLVDFGGSLDVYSPPRHQAKGAVAIAAAWQLVGRTLRQTIESEAPSRHES